MTKTSYNDLVPVDHHVGIVNTIIDHVDISALKKSYKGGRTSSYRPQMLLKVIIYAYSRNLYSFIENVKTVATPRSPL